MTPLIPRQPPIFGFTSGAGAAVVQQTNKSTSVQIDNLTGKITTNNAPLLAGVAVNFTVNNATVEAADIPVVALASGGTINTYYVGIEAVALGSFRIIISNLSGVNRSEALVINFAIIKGAAA